MRELAVAKNTDLPATAAEIRAQVNLIQQVMKSVMKKDVHYGIIPGCKKPSLLKPGAEKIAATFRLSVDPEITDLSTVDETHYRIKVRLMSPSGVFVGAGIGECSSNEEKYKWRKVVCEEEYEEADEDRRRDVWKRYGDKPAYQVKQVRASIADVSNTILKMGKKRALVDGVLTATAASDIFDQDLEDLPEGLREDNGGAAPAGVQDLHKDSPKKAALISALEKVAEKGWKPLQTAWGKLKQEERNIVGFDFGRIKMIAEANEAKE